MDSKKGNIPLEHMVAGDGEYRLCNRLKDNKRAHQLKSVIRGVCAAGLVTSIDRKHGSERRCSSMHG